MGAILNHGSQKWKCTNIFLIPGGNEGKSHIARFWSGFEFSMVAHLKSYSLKSLEK